MDVLSQFGVYLLLSLPLIGAYAMLATGLVVIFRASRVLNMAHGAMAMLPAYITYTVHSWGVPVLLAVIVGVAFGATFGAAVERVFVRPLARQGATAQTVGTIAVYGLVVAVVAQVYGSGSVSAPRVFPEGGIDIGGSALRWGQLGLFVTALVSVAMFFAVFRFTRIGLWMRGAAENPTAAALMGIDPDRMARLAWLLGGALAGLAGILLAAVTNLNPYTLSLQMLPAFVAALIGGLASLPGALVGAAVVGTAQGLVPALSLVPGVDRVASQVGMPQLVLTVLALGVLYLRGQRVVLAGGDRGLAGADEALPSHTAYDPELAAPRAGRRRVGRYVVLAALVAWPFVTLPSFFPVDQFSLLGDAILVGQYFIVAASIVMLTGWVGQISLAQASFVGIGAFGSALVARHFELPFPAGLLVGALLGGAVSLLLGLVALRVRGLYLAVATLIFAWMADEYLFVVPWFAGVGGTADLNTPSVGVEGGFPFFDFTDRRTFYFVMLAVASTVMFALLNLRDSKTGRAFLAVRGSEGAASSLGINVVRTKLFAFTLAGVIAGLAGNLIVTNQVTVVPEQFSLRASLLFLAIAVVGGLRSLGGAVAASILFAALSEVFFRVPALGSYLQLVSALLLAMILLLYPGGLAAVPATLARLRGRMPAGWAALVMTRVAALRRFVGDDVQRLSRTLISRLRPLRVNTQRLTGLVVTVDAPPPDVAAADAVAVIPVQPAAEESRRGRGLLLVEARVAPEHSSTGLALDASGITVRFGGLTAVSEASLRVKTGQIVGLIGPNGAGKTTMFNAISGLNSPSSGDVRLFGEDVTALPVHERAARGLGRTFQVIQLFPELTVFQNLLVATHLHNPTGPLSHIVATSRAVRSEMAAEETCRRAARFLDLDPIADRRVAGLPFGTLRMIELARALVTGAPMIMLDEPASGLDNVETDKLTAVLQRVREELGLSILLIEHDVRMVTAVTDYMYVLDRGRLISEGEPARVQRDPAVIKAYLGEPEPAKAVV
jgi:ABC-type branched-subunit amino acid transport system ATPase component/branched-subunit amino acid ABC-type transport system permease component